MTRLEMATVACMAIGERTHDPRRERLSQIVGWTLKHQTQGDLHRCLALGVPRKTILRFIDNDLPISVKG